ncbi:MAG: hypothetical protein BGO47_05875 [Microbacterium sp. 67-17]|jgi:hypothetical protein|uniref:TfoX/Sxy family protein n=1 Tax=Microbacterium sp. 67-17 TaxID=1895782 RepID=UPI00095B775C|nr:TfoX/Sxy family protein [Microbacterium sp. 67-17]OJV93463.1 MAG: hypothetical protein BGO47_05875 [Microbacterium sp. 67-17]
MSASEEREALAARIRATISETDVREMRMFGGVGFMVNDALAIVAEHGGSALVRTDPALRGDRLSRGAIPAVMSTGRVMGDAWLRLPSAVLADDAELAEWVAVGIHAGDRLREQGD